MIRVFLIVVFVVFGRSSGAHRVCSLDCSVYVLWIVESLCWRHEEQRRCVCNARRFIPWRRGAEHARAASREGRLYLRLPRLFLHAVHCCGGTILRCFYNSRKHTILECHISVLQMMVIDTDVVKVWGAQWSKYVMFQMECRWTAGLLSFRGASVGGQWNSLICRLCPKRCGSNGKGRKWLWQYSCIRASSTILRVLEI